MRIHSFTYFSQGHNFCASDWKENNYKSLIDLDSIESLDGCREWTIGTRFKYAIIGMKSGKNYFIREIEYDILSSKLLSLGLEV